MSDDTLAIHDTWADARDELDGYLSSLDGSDEADELMGYRTRYSIRRTYEGWRVGCRAVG